MRIPATILNLESPSVSDTPPLKKIRSEKMLVFDFKPGSFRHGDWAAAQRGGPLSQFMKASSFNLVDLNDLRAEDLPRRISKIKKLHF
jgi:hypothetical protein